MILTEYDTTSGILIHMSHEIEEGSQLQLDWAKLSKVSNASVDVLPVVVQDASSKDVLILAYMSEDSFVKTQESGKLVLYSTSRNELWFKGASSGNELLVRDIKVNCEQNSLLILVDIQGEGACHTKDEDGHYRHSCYYRSLEDSVLQGGLD